MYKSVPQSDPVWPARRRDRRWETRRRVAPASRVRDVKPRGDPKDSAGAPNGVQEDQTLVDNPVKGRARDGAALAKGP